MLKNQKVHERLNELMESKGLTKQEVAKVLNIPTYNLTRYLLGERVPSNDILFSFAKAYNFDIIYLLFGDQEPKLSIDGVNEFLAKQPKKDLFALIANFKETKIINGFRKEYGIPFKKMRTFSKDWWALNGMDC